MNDAAANDEIDLRELIRAVLATKNWLLVVLILASVLFWLGVVIQNLSKPIVYTYETRVNLTFQGAIVGQYPNETPFGVNDIVAPVVLNAVFEANGLEAYIERKAFTSSFSAKPFTPERPLILAKYNQALAKKNISVAEINLLQEEMEAELKKASAESVTITFTSALANRIPAEILKKTLRDIPAEWARHMVEEVGVTTFDQKVYSERVIDQSLFESIDYLIAFEMLLDRLQLLQQNIEAIKLLPNGNVVQDDVSGTTLPDLEKAISDVRRYRVAPLINPVRSLGIAKNPELVRLYFENELIEMKREIEVLRAKKANVEDAYRNYVGLEKLGSSASDGNAGMGVSPQLDTGFLERIVEMTNAGADITYRQELNSELLEASNALAETSAEIIRIEEIIQSMNGDNSATTALRESYTNQVNEQMPLIIEEMRTYFATSVRLFEKLSKENLGSAGSMFRYADGNVTEIQSGNILTFTNFRMYVILMFVVAVLTIPLVMIRNSLRTSNDD